MSKKKSTAQLIRDLHSEVDCRIEHGAESEGHLDYVLGKLQKIRNAAEQDEAVVSDSWRLVAALDGLLASFYDGGEGGPDAVFQRQTEAAHAAQKALDRHRRPT